MYSINESILTSGAIYGGTRYVLCGRLTSPKLAEACIQYKLIQSISSTVKAPGSVMMMVCPVYCFNLVKLQEICNNSWNIWQDRIPWQNLILVRSLQSHVDVVKPSKSDSIDYISAATWEVSKKAKCIMS
jgi:hypothetical protein